MIACFDGDAAGRKASLRALEVFLAAGLLGRGIFIPAGFDPDTLIRDQGARALRRADRIVATADRLLYQRAGGCGAPVAGRTRARRPARGGDAATGRESVRVRSAGAQGRRHAWSRRRAAQARGEPRRLRAADAEAQRRIATAGGRPPRADALATAEIGLLAIALARSDLRETILNAAPTADFVDANLAAALGGALRLPQGPRRNRELAVPSVCRTNSRAG